MLFGHTVSDLQDDIEVEGDKISGTLSYIDSGELPAYWGAGNFLALKFSGEEGATIKVGLIPSASGMDLIPLDADMNAVMQIHNKDEQKLYIEQITDEGTGLQVFDLSGLTLESE